MNKERRFIKGWLLADAVKFSIRWPDDYVVPNASVRHSLLEGDKAKLGFMYSRGMTSGMKGIEYLYVRITDIKSDHYIGQVMVRPKDVPVIWQGFCFDFGPENVFGVIIDRFKIKDGSRARNNVE